MTVGKRLFRWRQIQNMTQEELAKRTGLKREYISKIENDHLKNITLDTVRKLTKAFYYIDPSPGNPEGKTLSIVGFLEGVE